MTIIIYHYAMVRVEYRDTPPPLVYILNHQYQVYSRDLSWERVISLGGERPGGTTTELANNLWG